ncbi:MAG TPA: arylsulfatase [Flavisolibacter sp.]|nr:arylsulfatase [Flavisolibacter sp.]
MKRRTDFFINLVCCGVLLALSADALSQQKKPNIIFILADDLGYGDIGSYGQQKIETPNLDRLAKMGVRFTQFYSGSTVCAPARSSFMTGQHTGHTPVRGNKTFKPEGQTPLHDSVVTIAMLLKKAGYKTAAFGKWSLGFITTSGDPQKKGFDEFYGYNCQSLAHNYYPDHLWQNHNRVDLSVNLKFDSVYSADLIHQQAMNFLKAKHNQPFFLYLPYTLPHADVTVPHDEVYEYYKKKFNEQPVTLPKRSENDRVHYDEYPHAAFAAMVSRLDKYVGEVMSLLKQKGMEENTLVIFTSDNGPHREKGGDPDFFNGNGGLRGIKRDLYEGGIRVPFIAYQKGLTKAGLVNHQPAALWDLYPSFLALAGEAVPATVDGVSILPMLKGQPQKAPAYFYWEFHEQGGKQAVRMGDWKGIKLNVSSATPTFELYNLKTDPKETTNVATDYPNIVAQIEALMKEAYVPNRDWPLLPGETNQN